MGETGPNTDVHESVHKDSVMNRDIAGHIDHAGNKHELLVVCYGTVTRHTSPNVFFKRVPRF